MTFSLRNPVSENPHLRTEAPVVSRHETFVSAYRALLRLRVVARREGYLCEAFMMNDESNAVVPDHLMRDELR